MKTTFIKILLIGLVLFTYACSPNQEAPTGDMLVVRGDTIEKRYSVSDLKEFPTAQAQLNGITYVGVRLADLLNDAGFEAPQLSAVKVVASDGFTVNYDASLFLAEDTLVAYARADGPLAEDEGTFRMVVPGQGGKMNPRMVVEIQAIP